MHRETKLAHYGRPKLPGPANPPIVRASTILHETVAEYRNTKELREYDDTILSYGRRGTTTAHQLAEAVRDLEGGDACFLFPTGVAAISSTIFAFVKPGDHLLVVNTIFPATRTFCEEYSRANDVDIDYFPWGTTDLENIAKDNTVAVVVESPGSLTFEVMDLPALCNNAHSRGLVVIADNTYGSGWLYHPLQLGCDVSIIAGTKYLNGHADGMMGCATVTGDAVENLRKCVQTTGQTLGPDEAYACLRGMRTLSLRLNRHEGNGLALAKWFLDRVETEHVFHPSLTGHPGSMTWRRDSSGSNGLFSVSFKPEFAIEPFLDRLKLFSIGSSWGGFESLAMPIAPSGGGQRTDAGVPANMVRFHAGLEHLDDLVNDLESAIS